jgi:hypothetical protein
MISIEKISSSQAEKLCRKITADLPDYFGLPEANEHYAIGMHSKENLAAKIGDEYIGLISLEFPYPNNCNIYWMAVLSAYHKTVTPFDNLPIDDDLVLWFTKKL